MSSEKEKKEKKEEKEEEWLYQFIQLSDWNDRYPFKE